MRQTKRARSERLFSVKSAVLLVIAIVCLVSVATANNGGRSSDSGMLEAQSVPAPLRCEPEAGDSTLGPAEPEIAPRAG